MPTTPYTDGTTASSVARSGSTNAWTNPTNGLHEDGIYTTAGTMTGGAKTELFTVGVLPPASPLGASNPTLMSLKFYQHETASGWTAKDDYIRLTKSGTPVGSNVATLIAVETTDTNRVYSIDLVAAGITAADVDAGLVGVQAGYIVYPLDPNTFTNSANWDISVSPTSPQEVKFQATVGPLTTVYRVSATWKGSVGAQPDRVVISVTSSSQITTVSIPGQEGTGSADNGQGDTDSGQNPNSATGTHDNTITLDQTDGLGRPYGYKDFTVVTDYITKGGSITADMQNVLSAVMGTQAAVTVYVDSTQSSYTLAMSGGAKHHYAHVPSVGIKEI